ncbi:hypothetical protein BDN70DRAFT_817388, partial [Pholiota conissans]
HASLRNVIECIFGVCKRRFRLMAAAAEYSLQTQAKIPAALAVLHNFIHTFDPDDLAQDEDDMHDVTFDNIDLPPEIPITPENLGHHISPAERVRAAQKRDDIAKRMWEDYLEELHRRGI